MSSASREVLRVVGQSMGYAVHRRSPILVLFLVAGAVVVTLAIFVVWTAPVFLYPML